MTPAELRRWVVAMLRAGAGSAGPAIETVEPPITTRGRRAAGRKSAGRRTLSANEPLAGDDGGSGRSS